jgi:hypothetical protein
MSDSAALGAILSQVATLVKRLSQKELDKFASGDLKLYVGPKNSKLVVPLDLPDLASQVREIGSQDEIVRLLDADSRLTFAVLKRLAEELNIAVPAAVKTKGPMQLHIAQSAANHWHRTRGGL